MTTDPITQVAKEIRRQPDRAAVSYRNGLVRMSEFADRLLAYWTPERRAFMEAAEGWGANSVRWDGAVGAAERGALRKEAHEICVRMDALYRAMIEAEEAAE